MKFTKRRTVFLSLALFAIFLFGSIPHSQNVGYPNPRSRTHDLIDEEHVSEEFSNIEQEKTLRSSSFSESFSSRGDKVNLTVMESLLREDPSLIEFEDLSDNANNSFEIDVPKIKNFNSSLLNFSIDDIKLENKSLSVESTAFHTDYDFTSSIYASTSFVVNETCYLQNVSVDLSHSNPGLDRTATLVLYNATFNGTDVIPQGAQGEYIATLGQVTVSGSGWVTLNHANALLNTSKTDNNTFFVGLRDDANNDLATCLEIMRTKPRATGIEHFHSPQNG